MVKVAAFKKILILLSALGLSAGGLAASYDSFRPGAEWLDTDGNPIQAHGGSIITVGDTHYWYGENKAKTDGLTRMGSKNRLIWHWGVNLYSSKDLYIALADRWLPDSMDVTYPEVEAIYSKWFGLPHDAALAASYETKTKGRRTATRDARYVWLPVVFKDGRPTLSWKDEWKIEEYK